MIKCKVKEKFNTSYGIMLSVIISEKFKTNDVIQDENGKQYKVIGFVNPSGFPKDENIQNIRVSELN